MKDNLCTRRRLTVRASHDSRRLHHSTPGLHSTPRIGTLANSDTSPILPGPTLLRSLLAMPFDTVVLNDGTKVRLSNTLRVLSLYLFLGVHSIRPLRSEPEANGEGL